MQFSTLLDSQIGLSLILCVLTKLTGCGPQFVGCWSTWLHLEEIHLDRRPNNDFTIKSFNFFKYPKFLSYISDYQRCPSLCQKWNGQNDFDQFCSAGKKISVSWRKRMEKTGKFELLDITIVNFENVQTLPRDLIKPWPILVDS